jgi:CHAT domain-containing protein/tetratricopeptide (TPR) repeat protein
MVDDSDAQGLIDDFFDAVRKRHLRLCQSLLKSLRALSRKQPSLKAWCAYLGGILAFEIDCDWAEAERIFTELLQSDVEPALRGRIQYALGRSLSVQGRWDDAISAFNESLAISIELGQTLEQAKARKHIGITINNGFTRGDFGPEVLARAVEQCQLALDTLGLIADPLPEDGAWLKGSIWNTLGLIQRNLGQWDQAIASYRQDMSICQALDDRHGLGLSYGNLGEIYQEQGDWPEALAAYQQALTIIREFDNRYDEAEALANLAFLYQEKGEVEQAFDYYDQAVALIETLRAGISAEAGRAGFFATVTDVYANMVLLCLAAGRESQAFNMVERARSRAFLDLLAAHSPDLSRRVETVPMTLFEVQAALPKDALLLEYFTTGLLEAPEGGAVRHGVQRHRFPPARTLIFAVTHNDLQVYDTGISPNALRPCQLDNVVERHFLDPQIRRTFYDWLISPAAALVQDKHRLYLVPHGPLHYIPFQALIAPDGDTLLREEGPQLIYAPSATLIFSPKRREPGRASASCLALGYNGQGADRLRFAEEEARSVARLVGGQALAGTSSKKATLFSQGIKYRLLHFSCHGDFDPESPLASALQLAPGEALTALDVLDYLRLRCDLVTLSACESGLSRVRRGDELVGFMRAFMGAGAPALVSTLWRVDERSTLLLMDKFYREVQNGADFSQALKQAQLYLKSLTQQQALDTLVNLLTNDITDREGPPSVGQADQRVAGAASRHASAYLKGPAATDTLGGVEVLSAGDDAEMIFAEPYYWAPFILVEDCGTSKAKEE